jgi:hypothetical protein
MKLPVVVHVRQQRPGESHISTREGITPVKPDDLIMRGVSGEEYPIGRAIFEQTYTLDTTPPAQPAPVQDAEGENKAVRSFLMLYGQPGLTVGQMKKHMTMSGFKSWPTWVETEHDGAHLTKAGAQLWIRHLFALEATPPAHGITEKGQP